MPFISHSNYHPPFLFRNPHLNTVYPALLRQVPEVQYERERLDTPDGDFLDIDWSRVAGGNRLLLVLHGLESSSQRHYVKGLIRLFNRRGWDGLALNFRGCSGEPNRCLRTYHMGETSDLDWLIGQLRERDLYRELVIAGFSLGGNVALKYAGEMGDRLPEAISCVIAFSVPCHIASANREIDHWRNRIYRDRFLRSLNAKMEEKARRFPDRVKLDRPLPKDFRGFDDRFTGPLHGFRDAADYWEQCSSLQFLEGISRPTLLINARDDTFLSAECYPETVAEHHPHFYFEAPRYGGHVGFMSPDKTGALWSERRALAFAEGKR